MHSEIKMRDVPPYFQVYRISFQAHKISPKNWPQCIHRPKVESKLIHPKSQKSLAQVLGLNNPQQTL